MQEQGASSSPLSLLAISPAALVSEAFAGGDRAQHASEVGDKGKVRGL